MRLISMKRGPIKRNIKRRNIHLNFRWPNILSPKHFQPNKKPMQLKTCTYVSLKGHTYIAARKHVHMLVWKHVQLKTKTQLLSERPYIYSSPKNESPVFNNMGSIYVLQLGRGLARALLSRPIGACTSVTLWIMCAKIVIYFIRLHLLYEALSTKIVN